MNMTHAVTVQTVDIVNDVATSSVASTKNTRKHTNGDERLLDGLCQVMQQVKRDALVDLLANVLTVHEAQAVLQQVEGSKLGAKASSEGTRDRDFSRDGFDFSLTPKKVSALTGNTITVRKAC